MINPFVIIGGVLILLGVAIVGRMTFKFFLFVLKILFGLALIYFGYLITQSPAPDYSQLTQWFKKENIVFYSNSKTSFTPDPSSTFEVFSVAMSTAEIDLTKLIPQTENIRITVNSLFSDTTVIVNPDSPVIIHSNIFRGSAGLSGADPLTSGELNFKTQAADQSKTHIQIEGNALFGKINFITPADLKK